MPERERFRVEVGFDGGQSLSLLLDRNDADRLEKALAAGHETPIGLEADDGSYTVSLRKVAYLKRYTRESRVGFGNS